MKRRIIIVILLLTATLYGCKNIKKGPVKEISTIKIQQILPFDNSVFTQGLEINDGKLYVSSGMKGESMVGIMDMNTYKVMDKQNLDGKYFGEGITVTDKYVWQITWKEFTAFKRDKKTLQVLGTVNYQGEGWGLCNDGKVIFMSDGTNKITVRDKDNFSVIKSFNVDLNGTPVQQLNELEYANGYIFANVWHENGIVKIDPNTGKVVKVYNLTGIADRGKPSPQDKAKMDVLNGIAHIQGNEFYVTGKYWPNMFKVILD